MKKRILTATLTAAMASSIFGMTGNAAERELNIHWLSAGSASEAVVLAIQDIAQQYQEENPDLDFSFEVENVSDRTAYLQKLKILAASDELPEWFDSDPDTWFADIVADGKAYSFDDLYKELGMDDQIFDISKEYARLPDGSLNLMTLQCNTEYFFYNKDLFEQAGITEAPKTFDELLEDCQILQDADILPITMWGDWPILRYFAQIPFRMTGNAYIENAVSGAGSFGEEAGLKGAQFIQDIEQYFQEGWSSADYDTMVDLFASGQAAIMYNGTWALEQASMIGEDGNIKDSIGYFTMPTYSENDVTAPTDFFINAGIGTAIRTDAVDDEMKAWVKYMLEHYADASLSHNQLPSVMPDEETMEALPQVYKEIIENVSNVKDYAKCWDVVIDSALVEPLKKETVILALGQETPEEWAANMDEYVKNQQ
ncbi:MAG: extracellular solute-binding protein [Lachnospiraceae bacterium]